MRVKQNTAYSNQGTRRAAAFIACVALNALGCTADTTPASVTDAPRVFVGELSGSDAWVAIVATNERARVYFCGGAASYTTLTRWLTTDIGPTQRAQLKPAGSNDWGLEFVQTPHDIRGTLDVGDPEPYDFRATEVEMGTNAGLYEATADCGKVGLIVRQVNERATPIGQGACIENGPLRFEQVNPLSPLSRTSDGTLRVALAGSSDAITVQAAQAPK
jgi:hypothetical protein